MSYRCAWAECLRRVNAAIDVERRSGNETVEFRGKIDHGARDVGRRAGTPKRDTLNGLLRAVLGGVRVVEARSENESGRDTIHADSTRCKFVRERPRPRQHR